MAEYRKQTIVASIIAIVIASSVGLGIYYAQKSSSTTTMSPLPVLSNGPAIIVGEMTTNSTNGLELSMTLSSNTYAPGETIPINLTEINTLNVANNVSSASDWAIDGLALGGCGTLNFPFGIRIFQGYYDGNNISSASNQSSVQFYAPGVYSCPAIFNITQYAFQPSSDVAGSLPMSTVVNVQGSWTGGASGSTLHVLPDGVYTVVGGDEWGNLVIVHFTVTGT